MLVVTIGWLFFWQLSLKAQDNRTDRLFLDVVPDTFVLRVDSTLDSLQLPHHFIIPGSERVYRNRFKLLRGIHYRLFPRKGYLLFNPPLHAPDSVTVIYRKNPLPLIPEYSHRQIVEKVEQDTTGQEQVKRVRTSRLWEDIDQYSSNLQRSGSIVRGVEIGSNSDLTLNSGLNLQLSGYITPNVQLIAALTDQSTPIQPEGNTQTLREVDRVFVKIKSPYLGGTLGDFNLIYGNSQFGNLKRKLQGITAYGKYRQYHQQITYATSRGTFHSNKFMGQEGNQGPYQLRGKNGQREIIVLAGTERVYVNGILQKRGENFDYIIDYGLAQIYFTNKRLITSEDRIEVDFEYADTFQRYGKNLLGFSAVKQPPGSGLGYDVRFFREWDDTQHLLEDSAPLSDEEKRILAQAGDSALAASTSGARYVGDGNGTYVKRDTVIAGTTYHYFHYVGVGQGDYSVSFKGVGPGQGSYIKKRLGVYQFVGPGLGDYLPIKLIPLAGEKYLTDVGVFYRAGNFLTIRGEGAFSYWDQNVFSPLDDEDNPGHALNLDIAYTNPSLHLFGRKLGMVSWKLDARQRQAQFAPLDREYQPEYNYKWNLEQSALRQDERTLESLLLFQPSPKIKFTLNGGLIRRGEEIDSRRGKGEIVLMDSTIVNGRIFAEAVRSTNPGAHSDWYRLGGALGHQFGRLYPYIGYRAEDRGNLHGQDTLTGFYFTEKSAGLRLQPIWGTAWKLDSKIREDFLYNPNHRGERQKLATSYTHEFQMRILQSRNWQGRVSFVYREKQYDSLFTHLTAEEKAQYQVDPQFQDTTWIDRRSQLANMELQYRNRLRTVDSRWNYKVASELQARQEKVYLRVGENRGNYRWDETLQEYVPDPQGDYILIVVPTGEFLPVTNIQASWQLRFRPRTASRKQKGFKKLLNIFSTFTFIRVDDRNASSNVWRLYLLNPSEIHNNRNTLQGSLVFNQDIYLFERNPVYGFTLRSRFRDNLANQFVDANYNESRRLWDGIFIWRQKLWRNKLSQELEYKYSTNFRSVSAQPIRNHRIYGHSLMLKWNYRPVYAWQLRLGMEGGWQDDRSVENPLKVHYYEIKPEIQYSMKSKIRGTVNLNYLRVKEVANPLNRPIPFEMGKGKKSGTSLLWNLRFEYFVSTNISVTATYTGRRDAGMARVMHLGKAEVRAFF